MRDETRTPFSGLPLGWVGCSRFVGTHREYDRIDAATVLEVDMEVKPIRNEADYDAALATIGRLMGASTDTPEGDALVREYELASTA